MQYYLKEVSDVLSELKTSEKGLDNDEAVKRQEESGKNKLAEEKKDGLLKKTIKSIIDPMIIMLIVTAIISAVVAKIQGDSFTDVFIILFVVVINTIMGLVQESKAEKAIDSLKEMTAATSKVLRNGELQTIKSEDIVVGDVVVLEAGDLVPADCRVIESHSLKVDEAALTGESLAVSKMMNLLNLEKGQEKVPLADRKNMVYSGSTVAYGRGKAVVCSIGMDTEIGKIAESLQEAEKEITPLQRKMAELSKTLTKLVLVICLIVFVVSLVKAGSITAGIIINTTLAAVALAVAAIPEGLPAVVTIILSIGVTAMSKRNALIRKLNAVETLGCTQVICSDKTGTLTQNKMTVQEEYTDNNELLAKAMALCSDSIIMPGEERAKGEPTENGLVEYAYKLGQAKYELDVTCPRVGEIPFESMRKMMSTVHKEKGKYVQYTKGAIEILVRRCTTYIKGNNVEPLTEEVRNEILAKNKEYADRALRVLGAAYREYDQEPTEYESDKMENDLTFIGFVGMMDPCRDEVFDAIEKCKKASIRPIMITGDQKDTAVAIAKKLKIITSEEEAIEGADLENMSDEELIETVQKCSVYARVQPEHKTRIVRALKSLDFITAMTGDGVNDAPSIKAADVGVAMGITGTDVTKGVSDVVLADDNFATIVNAVEEGRKIYDNVRKVIQFQLSTNMAEVLTIFFASLFGVTILTPAHLLWINMITDSAPGLSLGMEKAEGDIMKRKPRPSNEGVFSNGAGFDMIWQGIIMAILVILSFFIGEYMESGKWALKASVDGMSMAFLTMNFAEMFHCVCMRSQRGSIFRLKTMNWWLVGAFVLTTLFTLSVIYVPFFVNLFGFATISLKELLVSFSLAFVIIPIIEIVKFIERKCSKKNA